MTTLKQRIAQIEGATVQQAPRKIFLVAKPGPNATNEQIAEYQRICEEAAKQSGDGINLIELVPLPDWRYALRDE